jgi:Family of unknown function (DUF5946)
MDETRCLECGAAWTDGQTCADHFNLMGFWELDFQLYEVHHLMVLCYHLQHPGLYSPEGLSGAMRLLVQFVETGASPQAVRRQIGKAVSSNIRKYRITGTERSHGDYPHPTPWTMTAADVVAAGVDAYYDSVRAWARSVLDVLSESANLTRQ